MIVVFSAKEMQCCSAASATLDDLEQRTSELGAYASEANFRSRFTQRQIRWSNVDSGFVRELLDFHEPPDIDDAADIEAVFQNVDDTIRSCISQARIADVVPNSVTANPWKKLAEENDSRKIWDAINWNGSVEDNTVKERPSNDEFKIHFEKLLGPPGIEDPDVSAGRAPYIPLLDDPFQGRTQDFRSGGGGARSAKEANKPKKRATELKPRTCAHQGSMFRPSVCFVESSIFTALV